MRQPVNSKISDIQALRAFAVMMVVVSHIPILKQAVPVWLNDSWSGVDLFFVISGFVVARAYHLDMPQISSPKQRILRFYRKRARRVLPLAFACLLFWSAAHAFFNSQGGFGHYSFTQVISQALAAIFLTANYVMALEILPMHLTFFWSLSVEEHFYLIFPWFRRVLRPPKHRIVGLIALILIVWIFLRPSASRVPYQFILYSTHLRLDGIAMGVLLHELILVRGDTFDQMQKIVNRTPLLRPLMALVLYSLVVLIAALPWMYGADNSNVLVSGLTALTIISVFCVAGSTLNLDLFCLGSRRLRNFLNHIGDRSYGLYLFHLPVYWFLIELKPLWSENLYINIVFYLGALIATVEILHRFIELPLMRKSISVV